MLTEIYQNPRELKYVTLSSGEIILLAPTLSHNDVTGNLNKGGLGPCPSPGPFPLGAGSCSIYWQDDKWMASCHGKSTTLGIKSEPHDAGHIERALAGPLNYTIFRTERTAIFSGSLPHRAVGSTNVCEESQGTCALAYDKENEQVKPTSEKSEDNAILAQTFNEYRF